MSESAPTQHPIGRPLRPSLLGDVEPAVTPPPRPTAIPPTYDHIPLELCARRQWVIWRYQWRDGRWTKVPYRAISPERRASSTDQASWSSFEQAVRASTQADGIGYVFAADDPYTGVDFDRLTPDATWAVKRLQSYTERSASGRGVHVIVRGALAGVTNRNRRDHFEVYDQARFFVVTGAHLPETPTHGDLLSYGTWLLTQPDDAYPLIRLPALIYRHSPVSRTRVCEERDRAALRASYRDLLFHFHLHSQINERILHELPELRVWCLYLHERLAHLTDEVERSKPAEVPRTRRSRRPTPGLAKWRALRADVEVRVSQFLDAADLLSRRYFTGADLLYPDIRRDLGDLLEFVLTLQSLCDLTFGSPRERRRAIEQAEHLDEGEMREQDANAVATRDAHSLAKELVVMARCEALTTLGERRRGVELVEAWMRESSQS